MINVSVIIPVKNGAGTLERCFQHLKQQTFHDQLEIIVLDSMSTDGSREIATKYGALVIDVEAGSFDHGLTRNMGLQYAKGALLYFTVQDAWITDIMMIEKMSFYFGDPAVAAVVGDQVIPWGKMDVNPAYWFKRSDEAKIEVRQFLPLSRFTALSQKEQFDLSRWDNVNAMYRVGALKKLPFAKTNFSEDWLWANEALREGMKLIRDPALVTNHYHHQYFAYCFKTRFIVSYHFYFFFRQIPVIPLSLTSFARIITRVVRKREIGWRQKIYWSIHNLSATTAGFLASLIFRMALLTGNNRVLNRLYKAICKEIPQGSQ